LNAIPAAATDVADNARAMTGWQASLALRFEAAGGRTRLSGRRHSGPLLVQRPFYPEEGAGESPCHVYLLHPPAGIVGGDRLALDVEAGAGSAALITTPAATKFYRSRGGTAVSGQRFRVEPQATLEWLPQENIVFDGARMQLTTSVSLEGNANFIGWEVICLGRPASGETLRRGHCDFRLRVERDGEPVLSERLLVEGGDVFLDAAAGLRGYPITGTLIATVADDSALIAARETIPADAGMLCGVTRVDGLLIARVLGADSERAKAWLVAVWEKLRPQLCGRTACHPRIWRT
jgi:urease accessory protein